MNFSPNNPFHYAYVICGVIFLITLLSSFAVGKKNTLKLMLPCYLFVVFIGSPIIFIKTQGLIVFAIPQLLFTYLMQGTAIGLGIVVGGHFHKPINVRFETKRKNFKISKSDYITLTEFSKLNNLQEERVIEIIRSGFLEGRIIDGVWYVHQSETSS